jgi:hypothetical protein
VRKVSSGFEFFASIIRSCIERVIFSKDIIEGLPGLTFWGDLLTVSIFQRTHTQDMSSKKEELCEIYLKQHTNLFEISKN